MKAVPQINVDLEAYPELGKVYNVAIKSIVQLMQVHNISELRRIQKNGAFDTRSCKDIVAQMGVENVPATVNQVTYAVGKSLLDYLETVGVSGITIILEDGDLKQVNTLWSSSNNDPLTPITLS